MMMFTDFELYVLAPASVLIWLIAAIWSMLKLQNSKRANRRWITSAPVLARRQFSKDWCSHRSVEAAQPQAPTKRR